MKTLKNYRLIPGRTYVFAENPTDSTGFIIGIFDRRCGGRVILEASSLQNRRSAIRYGPELPAAYAFVRPALSDEVRDFGFNYGYECGRRSALRQAETPSIP